MPSLGAINFHQGNLGGWSVDGIYDGDTTNKVSQAPGLVWLDESDISSLPKLDPTNNRKGSIGFVMGPGLPNTNLAASGVWRVDLVSPDLRGDSQWVGAKGVVAAFADMFTQFSQATPKMRFGFQVKKPDGSVYLREEVNVAGVTGQHPLLTKSGKFQISRYFGSTTTSLSMA